MIRLSLAVFLCLCVQALHADTRPNFIFFIADDISQEDFGCYGHPVIKTPHIDALAKEGILFSNAFLTTSSCSPSRCSILAGRYPHNTGAEELHMGYPEGQTSFVLELKEAGYFTGIAGKTHIGKATEHFDVVMAGGKPSGAEHWAKMMKEADEGKGKGKPFFLWLAAFDAHRIYDKSEFEKPFPDDQVILPPDVPDTPAMRSEFASYYDEVMRFDASIGKVMEDLRARGLAENTTVVVAADNGRPFQRAKTTLYHSGIKTPLVMHGPLISKLSKKGVKCEELVSAIDLAPTWLEWAGVKAKDPSFYQGKALQPLLENPKQAIQDWVYSEHNWHDFQSWERGVHGKRFTYIYNAFPEVTRSPPADAVSSESFQESLVLFRAGKLSGAQAACFVKPAPQEELYDGIKDPQMLNNLASNPEYKEKLEQMRALREAYAERTGDVVPEVPTPDLFSRESGERTVLQDKAAKQQFSQDRRAYVKSLLESQKP